jgi:hypothetical protein
MADSDNESLHSGAGSDDNQMHGFNNRNIDVGNTLSFVTHLEITQLLIKRMEQLNDPVGKFNQISQKIIVEYGSDTGLLKLMIAELMDSSIEYPLMLKRGSSWVKIHTDVEVFDEMIDMIVLTTETGEVSFNSVAEDLSLRPGSEHIAMLRDLERLRILRNNMGRRAA